MASSTPKPLSPAPARLAQYPPVPGPTSAQLYLELTDGARLDPSEYRSLTFNDGFLTKYGSPLAHFRAFERLMKVEFDATLAPKCRKMDFVEVAKKVSFIEFAKNSDDLAVNLGARVLGRRQMEGAFVQELFFKFDVMDIEKMKLKYPLKNEICIDGKMYPVEVDGRFEDWMQTLLKNAIAKRFSNGVEEYWLGKRERYQHFSFDIEKVEDDAEEPVESLFALVEEDDDEMEGVEDTSEVEAKMEQLDLD